MAFLDGLGIDAPRARLLATEGARLGCLFAHGLLREDSAILSDDAGQFDLGLHQFLCWIHAERLYRTLPVWSDASRAAVDEVRGGIWRTYRLLGAYCRQPSPRRRAVVERSFARTFRTGTGYRLLDEQIGRTLANRDKLLAVLDRPDVPAHTNGTENDLRVCVVRRKVSGGTRSDKGRACRDAFLTHMKTCARHGISFWNYLGDRLGIPGAESVPLAPRPRAPATDRWSSARSAGHLRSCPNRTSKPESRRFIPGFAPLTGKPTNIKRIYSYWKTFYLTNERIILSFRRKSYYEHFEFIIVQMSQDIC